MTRTVAGERWPGGCALTVLFVAAACAGCLLLGGAGVSAAWWRAGVIVGVSFVVVLPWRLEIRWVLVLGACALAFSVAPAVCALGFVAARASGRTGWWHVLAVCVLAGHPVFWMMQGAGPVSAIAALLLAFAAFGVATATGVEAARFEEQNRETNQLLGAALEREILLGHVVRRRERQALGRELHDSLGLHLATLRIYAQALQSPAAIRADDLVRAVTVIDQAATQAIDDLQTIVRQLGDGQQGSDPRTLGEVFDCFVRAAHAHKLHLSSTAFGSPSELPAEYQTTLATFFGETFTNALKYADPGSVRTVLVVTGDGAVFAAVSSPYREKRDDTVARSTLQGLLSLRARAKALGGSLVVYRSSKRFHIEYSLEPAAGSDG